MISEEIFRILRKQRYQIDNHTAVKLCGWVRKKMLEDKNCYKSKFYGIETHRCIQCTPSVIWCQQNCIFCWRVLPQDINIGLKDANLKEPNWEEPEIVFEKIINMHRRIIMGYKGVLDRVGEKKFEEALNPKHVAISLSGEPTLYPYLDELIQIFHKKGFTTFVVSNGILTEIIEKIDPTQLYISLDAYDLESYRKICGGKREYWESILNTLDILKEKKRTCIRTTLIRGFNDDILKFVELYERANAHFIELKSYMHVGYSQRRLKKDNMLEHSEIIKLARELDEGSDYVFIDDSEESRVALLQNRNRKIDPKIKK
ncbi:Wyosine base formation domain protein [Methanocaldococcus vulcanius M7]|uniref:S-adenosyl-L-methionine-dependent tRNA 4-demethylwyosine synthase n=1 Tax=Methanocaldococcus vulcanius (strain ATCC 700851 / DSM 12094 / M7) TaxID=579137 RepID=C9RIB3_METVM|nr:4-demethylwyosine synthase TYW1 [Methanocaldococcus vulcanius]ACX73315.1 Wyosine base formation domain protein [Methanocaldococcus vulcanius M7]